MLRRAHASPKLKRLKRRLGIPQYRAVGILESLWHMTATQAPRGDIGRWSNEDIAAELEWEGDADDLIAGLVECRWLDGDPRYRLIVHDWSEHADQGTARLKIIRVEGFAKPLASERLESSSERLESSSRLSPPRARRRGAVPKPVPVPVHKESSSTDIDASNNMRAGARRDVDSPGAGEMSANQLLALWRDRYPTLTERDLNQHRAIAVSITAERSPEEIATAIVGIHQLWPFNAKEKRPWTLRDLDRNFAQAVMAAQNHPELRAKRIIEEFAADG